MDTLDKDLDIRDKWLGIRQLKQEYQPHTYARTTKEGHHIPQKDMAQKAAEYLAKEQWGKKRKREEDTKQEKPTKKADKIRAARDTEEKYNTEEIKMEEIWETIKKFKRRKAPGPDEIPMELFQEMDNTSMEGIRELLNKWWQEEDIPIETLKARVVLGLGPVVN